MLAYPSQVPGPPPVSAQTATMPPVPPVVAGRGRSTRSTLTEDPAGCEAASVTPGDPVAAGRCTRSVVVVTRPDACGLLQAARRDAAVTRTATGHRRTTCSSALDGGRIPPTVPSPPSAQTTEGTDEWTRVHTYRWRPACVAGASSPADFGVASSGGDVVVVRCADAAVPSTGTLERVATEAIEAVRG